MALFKNDVSEYVTPGRPEPARLVVTIEPVDGDPDRHDVTAHVDDGAVIATGSFVVNPEWRTPGTRTPTKSFVPEPNRPRVGAQLFSALFSGALSRCWAQAVERGREQGALHIIIRSTSYAVHALPWELIADPTLASGSQYVAMSEGWCVIRERPEPHPDAPAQGPEAADPLEPAQLRIIALTSSFYGIDQANDPRIIHEAFPASDLVTVPDVRSIQLTQAFQRDDVHVVHVLGTGQRARQGWQDLVIGTADRPEVVSGRTLSKVLRGSALRLVVLAACDSDQLAAQIAPSVHAVIGIRAAISDASCLAFLGGLYSALASGATTAQAVASGRAQQVAFASSLGDEWAQPVLFQHADRALVLATSPGDSVTLPAVPDAPDAQSPEDRVRLLESTIRQANLRALREQWDPVGEADTPAFVRQQLEELTAALGTPTGVTR
ncbi:CHAT domain-containing protein [Humibacillus xanthopallidus]|uniref:CHAT domain-containing protein n=1 Tax=Humibacillus xanthopallidus TaxID=412689 RepID=A0A543PRA1_9MICO|nr:CHAT domain-containing protein [Humibacillus xanthopallidus]TQN46584.1 CHAT domain-containing protein [Humibacillus xanthopallidus]